MSYTINLTNGNVFAVVADGTINTTSSVTLVGKNYAGYGEFLDENFIQMLENFSNASPPDTPLTGQLWYDSSGALLKIYTGSIWKTISAATSSSSQPTNNVTGDLWFDTLNQQLKVYNGSAFIVVGPAYSSAQGVSGAVPLSINDTGGTPHLVTGMYANNSLVSVVNPGADFLPAAPYSSSFPKIYRGTTVWNVGVQSGNISNPGNVVISSAGVATITISSTGAVVTGNVSATGNIGGNYYTGNGRLLTGIEVSGTNQVSTTGNIFGGNILTNGMVSAAGSIRTAGYVSAAGNITGNYIFGNAAFLSGLPATYGNSDVATYLASGADTLNIITTANVRGATVSGTGSVISPSLVGGVITGSSVSVTGSVTGASASINGTVSASGAVSAAGGVATNSITNTGSNGTGNIGSSSVYFNTVFAKATSAQYADLAERFEADEYMPAGTVVELGGEKEITRAKFELTDEVFGVISTQAAYLMNGGAGSDETHPPIAMTGRVPVMVVGKVRKGQRLVSAGNGIARAAQPGEATPFNVIGRALTHKTTEEQGTVEAIVTIK